jgi:hypothetical protein
MTKAAPVGTALEREEAPDREWSRASQAGWCRRYCSGRVVFPARHLGTVIFRPLTTILRQYDLVRKVLRLPAVVRAGPAGHTREGPFSRVPGTRLTPSALQLVAFALPLLYDPKCLIRTERSNC